MLYDKILTYKEAADLITELGFMPFSKNPFGYVSLEDITLAGNWHTGLENDPWRWKDRLAFEKIASYSRVMDKRLTFISTEWYPWFLAAYRPSLTVEERYENGLLGNMAFRIYQCLSGGRPMNTHELKKQLGINKENGSKFENGLVELQVSMDVTVFGASRRVNKQGEFYGWLVSEYTTVEQWADPETLQKASGIKQQEAIDKIVAKIRKVSPDLADRDICRFLGLKSVTL